MTNTNETTADIIAEMRFHGQQNIDAEKDKPEYDILTVEGGITLNYADRLEAAHRREIDELKKQVGDVAKLREALSKSCAYFAVVLNTGMFNRVHLEALLNMAKAALAAPPRNCDVGTAEEQAERFILFCLRNSFRGVCNDSCKFANVNRRLGWQEIGQARCFPFWAQMPYEEGGDK